MNSFALLFDAEAHTTHGMIYPSAITFVLWILSSIIITTVNRVPMPGCILFSPVVWNLIALYLNKIISVLSESRLHKITRTENERVHTRKKGYGKWKCSTHSHTYHNVGRQSLYWGVHNVYIIEYLAHTHMFISYSVWIEIGFNVMADSSKSDGIILCINYIISVPKCCLKQWPRIC